MLDRARPGTLLCAPSCRDYCTWQAVNSAVVPGFRDALRRRRLAHAVLLRWMVGELLAQLLRGGDVIVEQPRRSQMWLVFCVRRLLREALARGFDLDFVDLDQCRFDLKDPVSKRRFKKSTRLLVSRPHRFSKVALRCSCRRPHEPLAGSTVLHGRSVRKTRFAECYPRKLAAAIADVVCG